MATIDKLFKVQKKSRNIKKGKRRIANTASVDEVTKCLQAGSSVDSDLEMLRKFDLNAKYGPCTGLTRVERWQRAEKFNFEPPQEILDIINKHSTDTRYTHNIWSVLKI